MAPGEQGIVVVGGGVGGLAVALALGRTGHRVTILERDVLPMVDDPEAAFAGERNGAPQAHQTHGFLARLVLLLRERFPDVLADLVDAGCSMLPLTADLGDLLPGDEDLAVLVVRRTTLEWALRRAALASPNVELRPGAGVAGLVGTSADSTGPATVTGVRLDDGSELAADAVIASTGRRGMVPEWLGELGVDVPETVHQTGLVYLTRWYRLPGRSVVDVEPKLAGDLGFVKYLAVPGDGGTFSVTLAIRSRDAELRAALVDPDRFDRACHLLEGPAAFFALGPVEPLGPVRPMGGLVNRLRAFVDAAGQPTVTGFHAIGDAHTCTNPLYGRGCSLAVVHAVLLADAFAAYPADAVARAVAFEAGSTREVEPWFHVSVQMDAAGMRRARERGDGPRVSGPATDPLTAVFAAGATDPVIGRGLLRFINLLTRPDELMTDADFASRVAAVVAAPETVNVPAAPPGPTRAELLAEVAA